MKTRKYIIAVGNAEPSNYEVYCITAKNRDQAIFQAALKCKKDNWNLLSIESKGWWSRENQRKI
jgi:hypothetical protein